MGRSMALWLGVIVVWGMGGRIAIGAPPVPESPVPPEVCLWVQRLRLAALKHVAATPEAAESLARTLGYAQYAHPLTMCGPLTASILWEAGVLSDPGMIPEFWLLSPNENKALLRRAFPSGRWQRFDFYNIPISMFDFHTFPLIPGDVVYLYSGRKWRGFEHVLVVSYVDAQDRVYAVSNVGTPKGYVVKEVLLYDPQDPSDGYFIWWNDHTKKSWLGGLTGTAGFTVWRQKWLMPYARALAQGACAWRPPVLDLWSEGGHLGR